MWIGKPPMSNYSHLFVHHLLTETKKFFEDITKGINMQHCFEKHFLKLTFIYLECTVLSFEQ